MWVAESLVRGGLPGFFFGQCESQSLTFENYGFSAQQPYATKGGSVS